MCSLYTLSPSFGFSRFGTILSFACSVRRTASLYRRCRIHLKAPSGLRSLAINDIESEAHQIYCQESPEQRPNTALSALLLANEIRTGALGTSVCLSRVNSGPALCFSVYHSVFPGFMFSAATPGSCISGSCFSFYGGLSLTPLSNNHIMSFAPCPIRMHAQRVVRVFPGSAYLRRHPAMAALPVLRNSLPLVWASFAPCMGGWMSPRSSVVLSCSAGTLLSLEVTRRTF